MLKLLLGAAGGIYLYRWMFQYPRLHPYLIPEGVVIQEEVEVESEIITFRP